MIGPIDATAFLSLLLSASLRTLPLAATVWFVTRDRWGLSPRTKALFWWLVPVATLGALLLPPLFRLPIPQALALGLVALWALSALARIGVEIRNAVRLRRMVDGAVPLTTSEAGLQIRLLGSEMGLDLPPRLCASAYVPTPVVLRILSPTVLVPDTLDDRLTPEDLRMLLAHELAHVRRGDLPLALVPALACALFPFHPAIWHAQREGITEREAACDADAIAATGAPPALYGALLMKILSLDIAVPYRGGGLSPALGATANLHSLKRRLMLMKPTSRPPSPAALALSITALAGAVVLGAAAPALANNPPQGSVAGSAQAGAKPLKKPNLVRNGDFESAEGLSSFWEKGTLLGDAEAMGVSVAEDATVAHSGGKSLRFNRTTPKYFPVLIMNQEVPFDAKAKKIKLGMWVKAAKAGKATLAVWFMKDGEIEKIVWGGYVQDENGPLDHDWKLYDSVLAIPPGTEGVMISLQMYGPGTVWMDDVTAQFVPDNTPLKPAIPD